MHISLSSPLEQFQILPLFNSFHYNFSLTNISLIIFFWCWIFSFNHPQTKEKIMKFLVDIKNLLLFILFLLLLANIA